MSTTKIIEFKAHCANHAPIKAYLEQVGARYIGEDHQIDTYFNVPAGRLKLREGNIERTLIFYQRPDQAGPKLSNVSLYPVQAGTSRLLRKLLEAALGIKVVVDKRRHIYFIDNVKIHLDHVKGLGTFIEVEAIDQNGTMSLTQLREQCDALLAKFEVQDADLITHSYSDMLLEKRTDTA